jgi:hypothetical protein
MLFSPDVDNTPAMVLFHARRAQTAWECLAEVFQGKDYRVNIQVSILAASSYILICMTQTALLYLYKTCCFIEAGGMQFVPTSGHPPEFSEDLHETLVALSQTIYWANYLFLMRNGPEPRSTAKLEREFRQELQVRMRTPNLLQINLIFYYSKSTPFSLRSVL